MLSESLCKTLGLVGKIGGFEAVPGLGVETCLDFVSLRLTTFLLSSPKLLRFGLPGQFRSMNGSLIGTPMLLEDAEAALEGGDTRDEAGSETIRVDGEIGGVRVRVKVLIISGELSALILEGLDEAETVEAAAVIIDSSFEEGLLEA